MNQTLKTKLFYGSSKVFAVDVSGMPNEFRPPDRRQLRQLKGRHLAGEFFIRTQLP